MELSQDTRIDGDPSEPVLEWMNQFSDELVEQFQVNDNSGNNESQSVEFTNVTGTSILDLNDHCLLDIFSVNRALDLLDYWSIAKTCKRFEQLTSRVISERVTIHRHNKKESGYGYGYGCGRCIKLTHRHRKSKVVKTILKQFGSILAKVRLDADLAIAHHEDGFALDLVARYCVGGVLKELAVVHQKVSEVFTDRLRPIFKSLTNLYLKDVTIGDPTLFAGLNSLIEMECMGENISAILENVFPKLQSFYYDFVLGLDSMDTFVTFVSRHKTLRRLQLSIEKCDIPVENTIKNTSIQAIGNNCIQLEKLFIKIGTLPVESYRPLQSLKSLRDLTLGDVVLDDFEGFSGMKELRSLSLFYSRVPLNANQFVHLNRLTTLNMIWCSNRTIDVVGIVRQLRDLECLKLYADVKRFYLDEEKYSKIVDIVKDRHNVLTLHCEFDFTVAKYTEKTKVRLS